ncbi:HAMP domain-containing sensor histidine kinase [Spirulina sp. CS-785/01]|uniref:sensor histidine kinase n=1 Tax=Spirulina sp. CS-785/01 TaxID=3021716 RepID=UPI00232ACBEB|nr:HAMP domain-containing sensor histidine kinase [Spirulina sp. CS-785/01]MDB9312073.1 HAMP domain-containing sensor histidine kinase [Spirulina sp. CS-785/01]
MECYAGQLNQVFMNLLSNAIDALEQVCSQNAYFHPQITIHTTLTPDQQASIAITDNGPGIPNPIQAKIFNPFFTTKSLGQGTGMGLSISYQIITEKHGGELTCHSSPGEGTTFTILIPLKQ